MPPSFVSEAVIPARGDRHLRGSARQTKKRRFSLAGVWAGPFVPICGMVAWINIYLHPLAPHSFSSPNRDGERLDFVRGCDSGMACGGRWIGVGGSTIRPLQLYRRSARRVPGSGFKIQSLGFVNQGFRVECSGLGFWVLEASWRTRCRGTHSHAVLPPSLWTFAVITGRSAFQPRSEEEHYLLSKLSNFTAQRSHRAISCGSPARPFHFPSILYTNDVDRTSRSRLFPSHVRALHAEACG